MMRSAGPGGIEPVAAGAADRSTAMGGVNADPRAQGRVADAGWRRGRACADDVVAVRDAARCEFAGGSMVPLASERWGSIERFFVQISGRDGRRPPLWWDFEIDGRPASGLTDGFAGGPWGNTGHVIIAT